MCGLRRRRDQRCLTKSVKCLFASCHQLVPERVGHSSTRGEPSDGGASISTCRRGARANPLFRFRAFKSIERARLRLAVNVKEVVHLKQPVGNASTVSADRGSRVDADGCRSGVRAERGRASRRAAKRHTVHEALDLAVGLWPIRPRDRTSRCRSAAAGCAGPGGETTRACAGETPHSAQAGASSAGSTSA
jgi:hypothetical protein